MGKAGWVGQTAEVGRAAHAKLQVCLWGPGGPTKNLAQGRALRLSPWHEVAFAPAPANSFCSPVPPGPQSWLPSPLMRRPCTAHWLRAPWHHLRTPRRKTCRAAPPGLPCLGASPPRLRPATRASSLLLLSSLERQYQLVQTTVEGRERPLAGPESRDNA